MGRPHSQLPKGTLNPSNTLEKNLLLAEYGALEHSEIGRRVLSVYTTYSLVYDGFLERDEVLQSKSFQSALKDLTSWFQKAVFSLDSKRLQEFVEATKLLQRRLASLGNSVDAMVLAAPVIRYAIKCRDGDVEWTAKELRAHLKSEGIERYDEASIRRIRRQIDPTPRKAGRPKRNK